MNAFLSPHFLMAYLPKGNGSHRDFDYKLDFKFNNKT
jgi:hypothetical protein